MLGGLQIAATINTGGLELCDTVSWFEQRHTHANLSLCLCNMTFNNTVALSFSVDAIVSRLFSSQWFAAGGLLSLLQPNTPDVSVVKRVRSMDGRKSEGVFVGS